MNGKKCKKCGGRSFMMGYCLTCEHVQANAANRINREPSLITHALLSLKKGFISKGEK